MTTTIRTIRRLAIAAAIACALPAAYADGYTWTPIVTNGDTVPGTTAKFNSYNQPAVNNNGLVVFRARGRLPEAEAGRLVVPGDEPKTHARPMLAEPEGLAGGNVDVVAAMLHENRR